MDPAVCGFTSAAATKRTIARRTRVGRHEELTPWRQQELTRCRKFSTGVFDGRGSTQVIPFAVGRTAEGGDARAGGGIGPAPVEGAGFWYASHCAHAWDQSQHGQEPHRGWRLEGLQATGAPEDS